MKCRGCGWHIRFVGAVVLTALAPTAGARAGDRQGWLNVRECGASGSAFQTTAVTTAGSREITVATGGDFQVGQGVMLSKCHPHICDDRLWGPKTTYGAKSGRRLKGLIDIRGLDNTAGSWTVYVIDVHRALPPRFRWSDDMGRTWKPDAPISYDWQPLRGGLEIRFQKFEWLEGYSASFSLRDQLLSQIEKIDGRRFTVKDPIPQAATGAVLRHRDDTALQAAIDRGLKEKKNVHVPVGHYCLARGLSVRDPAGFRFEGADGENTVLDISEGQGCCVEMHGGAEATVRNFKMLGNMGFAERDQAGHFPTRGSGGIWGQDLKTSFAPSASWSRTSTPTTCRWRRFGPAGRIAWEPLSPSSIPRPSTTSAAGPSTAPATASTTTTWPRTRASSTAASSTSAAALGRAPPGS